ncbi:glycerophosphodiester phosphodiesterase family protein [soil metagenome]
MPELDPAFLRLPLAHRGLHARALGIVENSRAAIRAAVEAGYGVEIDIQRAACGEAMVFHDEALPRLTGASGLVADHSAASLARIALTGSDETIPTLADILALVRGRVPLLVEIKDQTGALGPEVGPLEARVAACLCGYDGPLAVMSFNPHSVGAMREAAPGVPHGLTSCAFRSREWALPDYRAAELAGLGDADRLDVRFVSHDRRDLANPALARLKARGLPVLTWTIRSMAEEAAARPLADNITFEAYRPVMPAR